MRWGEPLCLNSICVYLHHLRTISDSVLFVPAAVNPFRILFAEISVIRGQLPRRPRTYALRAFTLVELLVVIAIIGVLVALLLPAIQAAREASRRSDCLNRMHNLVVAAQNYHAAQGKVPPHGDWPTALSSQARCLPYMEQQSIQNLVDQTEHWREGVNRTALNTPLPFLRCPSGKEKEMTYINGRDTGTLVESNLKCHYVGNMGARTDTCAPGGGGGKGGGPSTWTTYPESAYENFSCSDDPATIPSTMSPPPVNDPGGSPGTGGVAINGVIFPVSNLELGDVTDGTTNTIMFGEASWDIGPQEPWIVGSTSRNGDGSASSPYGVVYNAKNVRWPINARRFVDEVNRIEALSANASFGSYHPGGANVGMSDGSAKFVRDDVDVKAVLRPMASRGADEVFELPL
jgi:prepilin-type N-terminal cleavage/methylation domain-containing protein/prepilin-type processing-associated H-X9-DG protein